MRASGGDRVRFRRIPVDRSSVDGSAQRRLCRMHFATANLNADLCARAYHGDDAGALDAAVTIRKLFDGKPLVSGVKALLAHVHGDPGWAEVMPPLKAFSAADSCQRGCGLRRRASRARRLMHRPAAPAAIEPHSH